MGHRIDWALFKVDSLMGKNRHRYRYNHDSKSTDFFQQPGNIDHGEGEICQETCIVEGNEKVFFVGQTNGRLEGEVNPALRAIVDDGRKTLEHHIIICPGQRKQGKEYAGDSGAAVLRDSDSKMLGLVWGCYNKDPIFTPIRTVFTDIKTTLGADKIDLPGAPETTRPTNQIRLISGSEEESPKLRPFKSSDIVLPKMTDVEQQARSKINAALLLQLMKSGRLNSAPHLTVTVERSPSPSPAPSLSFSSTPSPSSPHLSTSPTSRELTPMSSHSDQNVVVIDEIVDEGFEPSHSHKSTGRFDSIKKDQLENILLKIENKLSIPYLLCNEAKELKPRLKFPKPVFATLTRSWSTW
jgi:hypothetical protein